MSKFLIGIDEVGRGPLAGPVAVGVFAVRDPAILATFKGARDSKKMTPKQREAVFMEIEKSHAAGDVFYAVEFSSAAHIDEKGIVSAIRSAMNEALKRVEKNFIQGQTSVFGTRSDLDTEVRPLYPVQGQTLDYCEVRLDGTLKAPPRYTNQKTIIRGDDSEPVISLASICAKVLRDRHMVALAEKYPQYGFDIHKGYGTKAHYAAIKKYGPSDEHRRSFVK
ncbi:MAG: ribonuclease HII [Patescibacteria group bacterium]|nr:ribonuclease HII [Patescibacteria group bacterium]